jgi:hypothetical protein
VSTEGRGITGVSTEGRGITSAHPIRDTKSAYPRRDTKTVRNTARLKRKTLLRKLATRLCLRPGRSCAYAYDTGETWRTWVKASTRRVTSNPATCFPPKKCVCGTALGPQTKETQTKEQATTSKKGTSNNVDANGGERIAKTKIEIFT